MREEQSGNVPIETEGPVEAHPGGLPPMVSIIIPCRNERYHIEGALQSILRQELPNMAFEIIVADGMSDDGTRELLARLATAESRLRVIDNPGRIIPAGLNAAIKAAHGKIIVRMDAHTEYAPDYLLNCVTVLCETGADNVGGPWIAEGKGAAGRAVAAAFRAPFAVGGADGHNPEYGGLLDTVYLGCWPIETFRRIGLFDEEFVRSEDDELNLRLTRSGGRIWQSPLIKSWYHPRESLRSLLQQQIQNGYWKVRVVQKHKMPASVRHLVPAVFVMALVTFGLASPWSAPAAWTWLAIATAYCACNIGASAMAARREKKLFPLLVLVFACYHFGYGYGFLRGIWDFGILRRGPRSSYAQLTRPIARPSLD